MKHSILILLLAVATLCQAQNYLSTDKENEIKGSGNYYWQECTDATYDAAKACATSLLTADLEMAGKPNAADLAKKACFDQLETRMRVKVLAWMPKSGSIDQSAQTVQTTQTTSQPKTVQIGTSQPKQTQQTAQTEQPQQQTIQITSVQSKTTQTEQPKTIQMTPAQSKQAEAPTQPQTLQVSKNSNVPNDPVINALRVCKDYREVRQVVTSKGLMKAERMNSSEGFTNPADCMIAVFNPSTAQLVALLLPGKTDRVDAVSGRTIEDWVYKYSTDQYNLWYLYKR